MFQGRGLQPAPLDPPPAPSTLQVEGRWHGTGAECLASAHRHVVMWACGHVALCACGHVPAPTTPKAHNSLGRGGGAAEPSALRLHLAVRPQVVASMRTWRSGSIGTCDPAGLGGRIALSPASQGPLLRPTAAQHLHTTAALQLFAQKFWAPLRPQTLPAHHDCGNAAGASCARSVWCECGSRGMHTCQSRTQGGRARLASMPEQAGRAMRMCPSGGSMSTHEEAARCTRCVRTKPLSS